MIRNNIRFGAIYISQLRRNVKVLSQSKKIYIFGKDQLTPEGFLTKYEPLDPCDILSGKIPLSIATSACHTKSLNAGSSRITSDIVNKQKRKRKHVHQNGTWKLIIRDIKPSKEGLRLSIHSGRIQCWIKHHFWYQMYVFRWTITTGNGQGTIRFVF